MENNIKQLVSVIIPAYNEEKYIAKSIGAILRQDYEKLEVIIINNSSTDKTSEIVEELILSNKSEINIKLVYEKNKGTQFAREAGRRVARGSIIAQMDADCVPSSSWISTGVQILQKKEVVAVSGPYYYFDAPSSIKLGTLFSQFFILKPINSIIQLAKRGAIMIGGNAIIKAGILETSGGYNTDISFYGDDVDLALQLSEYGKVVFSNKLVMPTSSRRYMATGFLKVQRKYNQFFFRSVFRQRFQNNESIELFHPR